MKPRFPFECWLYKSNMTVKLCRSCKSNKGYKVHISRKPNTITNPAPHIITSRTAIDLGISRPDGVKVSRHAIAISESETNEPATSVCGSEGDLVPYPILMLPRAGRERQQHKVGWKTFQNS